MLIRTLYDKIRGLRRRLIPRESVTAYADMLRSFVGRSAWCVDSATLGDGLVEMSGWALAEPNQRSTFALNGRRFAQIEYGIFREDIQRLFWFWPNASVSGFRCQTGVGDDKHQIFALDFVDAASMQPLTERHSYLYREPQRDLPLPSVAQRRRVHGLEDEASFVFAGVTNFYKLQAALFRVTGRDFSGFRNILDWGCGCGRVTRHLIENVGDHITGVDIDRENVDWCANHLPHATFQAIPLRPPTDLPSGRFDVVIGLSVLTHLAEVEQDLWLAELARITAPGAVLLLTTHGRTAVARSAWPDTMTEYWLHTGFISSRSSDFDAILPDAEKEYYRTSYHTLEYVRNRWTIDFEILDIVTSYIGNAQDLVVLRRRSR